MLDARLNAFRRIVTPAPALSWIPDESGHHRVVFHPALPILLEIRAEFSRCFRLGGLARPGLRRCQHRQEKHPASPSKHDHTNKTPHLAPPIYFTPFSRSHTPITTTR